MKQYKSNSEGVEYYINQVNPIFKLKILFTILQSNNSEGVEFE